MKEKVYSILENVKDDKISIQQAQEQLFDLFGYDGDKFAIGAKVQVTKCIYGHEFQIGEVVTIIKQEGETWICENVHGDRWYLFEEEGFVVKL